MRIGLAAVSMELVSKQRRLQDLAAFFDEAAQAGCEMLFFPEYVNCQRTAEAAREWDAGRIAGLFARHAERVPEGPTASVIIEQCKRCGLWCGFGISERHPDGRCTNSFVLVNPAGEIAGRHIKTHLPPSEDCLAPADSLETLDSPLGALGVLICYELYFPELARLYQILGADILCYPTADNSPMVFTIAQVRALETHRPMLVVGYTWPEKPSPDAPCGCGYIDSEGRVVARSENRRQLLVVDVPRQAACDDERFRRRRPEMYGRLCEPC